VRRVLVIGCLGMLGPELVRVFAEDGSYEVTGWDMPDIDISDEKGARERISGLKPHIIINSAAYNAVDKAEEPEAFEIARKINGLSPGYLAAIAKDLNALFLHYSTDYIFDGRDKEGYDERSLPNPLSRYGESKLLGEQEVERSGDRYYLVRLQKLFGRPSTNPTAKKSFFETMLTLAKTRDELKAVDEELANFTYAPDLAAQTKYLLESGLPYGIYHVTNEGRPATWYGATKILLDAAGISGVKVIPVPASEFPRPARRPEYSILINTKLPPLRSWTEALEEFLTIYTP
jgi:dTDP-4-dehydrorhamnose reductase